MRKKISFFAVKRVPQRVKVNFKTSVGKRVTFQAIRRVPRVVKVKFYARKRR